jgi:hypothetical protein
MSIKFKTFLESKNLIQRLKKKKIKKSEQDMSKIIAVKQVWIDPH